MFKMNKPTQTTKQPNNQTTQTTKQPNSQTKQNTMDNKIINVLFFCGHKYNKYNTNIIANE